MENKRTVGNDNILFKCFSFTTLGSLSIGHKTNIPKKKHFFYRNINTVLHHKFAFYNVILNEHLISVDWRVVKYYYIIIYILHLGKQLNVVCEVKFIICFSFSYDTEFK